MTLAAVIRAASETRFNPRTLEQRLSPDLFANLSPRANWFMQTLAEADGRGISTALLMRDDWRDDPAARRAFERLEGDDLLEVMVLFSVFVHEAAHQTDLLISPFGLQYYANLLREYQLLQSLMPQMLDDPATVREIRFLAGLDERIDWADLEHQALDAQWRSLVELVRVAYAWGDLEAIPPLGKYIVKGWGPGLDQSGDPFGVGLDLEPVTVLGFFHSFRPPDRPFWYIRPLTFLETKAVSNSLLYVVHLLGEGGIAACRRLHREIYGPAAAAHPDYRFVLDLGARLYAADSFDQVLASGNAKLVRSVLICVSGLSWFALHAPPPFKGTDPRGSNPVLRFWGAYGLMRAVIRGKLAVGMPSMAEVLDVLDEQEILQHLHHVRVGDSLDRCRQALGALQERNRTRTWHPKVAAHFAHLFGRMLPQFAGRKASYASGLGMPDTGSPLMHCRSNDDVDVVATDYEAPSELRDWFDIRSDLYFRLNTPAKTVIDRLDAHFQAFLVPHFCECGSLTPQWHSRFSETFVVRCNGCGREQVFDRSDARVIHFASPD